MEEEREANLTTLVVRRSVLEGKSFLVNTLVPTIRQLALEKACVLLKTDEGLDTGRLTYVLNFSSHSAAQKLKNALDETHWAINAMQGLERLLKSTKDVVPVVNEDITTLSIELGRCYQFHQSPDKEAGSVIIQPSRLFQDLKLPSRAVPLEASPLLRPTDYQELRNDLAVCNLQLVVKGATAEEIATFPARMSSADGAALSPVLKSFISRWGGTKRGQGLTMTLDLNIPQETLDSIISGIYKRTVNIDESNLEDILLLADYLQIYDLGRAAADYAQRTLPQIPCPAVYKLAVMHPELGLFSQVVQTFIARGPSAEGFVAVFSLAAPSERHMLCTCARMLLSHRTRLEYVLAAARREDFALSDAEILLGPGYEEIAAQVWLSRDENALQKLCVRAVEMPTAPQALLWNLPLKISDGGSVLSLSALELPDGRAIHLRAQREGEKVSAEVWGGQPSRWIGDECFVVTALRRQGAFEVEYRILPGFQGQSWGYDNAASRLASEGNATQDGGYLPVALTWRAAPAGRQWMANIGRS